MWDGNKSSVFLRHEKKMFYTLGKKLKKDVYRVLGAMKEKEKVTTAMITTIAATIIIIIIKIIC